MNNWLPSITVFKLKHIIKSRKMQQSFHDFAHINYASNYEWTKSEIFIINVPVKQTILRRI